MHADPDRLGPQEAARRVCVVEVFGAAGVARPQ